MSENLFYRETQASPEQIEEHLINCSNSFTPPLSERVDIKAYSEKIAKSAITVEAWADIKLVGLIAMYENVDKRYAFITNVSVLPQFMGQGIAGKLLHRCFERMKEKTISSIELEVNTNNDVAINFYIKHGFSMIRKKDDKLIMHYSL